MSRLIGELEEDDDIWVYDTRFDFSFGLGNKCRKIFAVRLPNSEVKFSHMMCGNCSETFGKFASFTSCRMTASEMPKYAVGPNGKCETTKPSGSPRCSWTMTTSVNSLVFPSSTRSGKICDPRLILDEVGNRSFSSLQN